MQLTFVALALVFAVTAPQSPILPDFSAMPAAVAALAAPDQAMRLTLGDKDVDGFSVDTFNWSFAGSRRTATIVRNNVADPTGQWGGYMRRFEFTGTTGPRSCVGATQTHPGFGFAVNHFGNKSVSSRWYQGHAPHMVLQGRNHALLEQSWTYPIDGHPVTVTVRWLFATGRANPLWAVTFDTSAAPANAIKADTRAPYGDIAWDGGVGAPVDGVGWGDRKVFKSLGAPLSVASGWDYTADNVVPYTLAYSNRADAEMGLVQTQSQEQHDAGGYWGTGAWGKKNEAGPMPSATNWPYQLNQWELPYTNASKRMAWGSNYGAVGQTTYPALGEGRSLSGYPFQSYSTYIVIGNHSTEPVQNQVHEVESLLQSTVEAGTNSVLRTDGPGGVGRSDVVPYAVPGLNPTYNAFELDYRGHVGAPMEFTVQSGGAAGGATTQALVIVHNWPAAGVRMQRDGSPLLEGFGYFSSYDADAGDLWLTVADLIGAGAKHSLRLVPQPDVLPRF